MRQIAKKSIKALAWTVTALLGCASAAQAADPLIGKNYQITTIIGNETKTYTLTINAAGSGNYYRGELWGTNVVMTGPKTGSQICLTSEALYDYAYTFCFNGTVKSDKKAFTTVSTWGWDDAAQQVYLYSDVYRATVVRYVLRPTAAPLTAQSAHVEDTEARNQRGLQAFEKLDALTHQ
jgi:hypothetical protein